MNQIIIDVEFQALIPALSTEERAQLEANIVADGCRDPLVLWQNVLIDGHNRHEICTRLGLVFASISKDFDSREDATEWIINNQFGRRNLSDYQRGVLALRMKPIYEARAKAQQLSTLTQNAAVSEKSRERTPDIFTNKIAPTFQQEVPKPAIRTDEAVANLANISSNTIRKIEQIEKVAPPEVKAWAAAGEVSINLVAQFVDLPVEVQQEAITAISTSSEAAKEVIREAVKKAHVSNNSGNNEWYTPAKHIELARLVMGGIDTDPATSEIANRTVKAAKIYTADDDGRAQVWSGRVWMNPPYAQPLMGEFAELVSSKYESGEIDQACILVNNATETQWFQRMLLAASAVCFPKKRIKFLDPDGNPAGAPLQGQAIVYMGMNVKAFHESFSAEGRVLINA